MTRIKRLTKEGSWIVISQIAVVAGALVLVRVLTEYLAPAQYGQLALGLTVAGLVNQVVMGGVTNGIGRFYSIAAEKQDLVGYLHATRYLLAYATAAAVAIGLILMASLYWLGYSQWIGLAAAALVFSVFSGYNSTLSAIQNAARQRAIVAFHGGADAWLKILLTVGFVLWLGTSSTAVVIGYACSSLLITVSQLSFLRRTISQQQTQTANHQQWTPQIWAYSLPFTTWGAFTWMQQVSDRWALQAFASASDVGQYAVLFQLGFTPIALITGMAMSFLGPIMYQRSGDATDHARNTNVHRIGWWMTHFSLIVTLLGFAITFALHEWFFGLLVASEYRGISYLLPWVVLAGGIFAAGQMLSLKLMSEMKSSAMTTAKIVTALIGILLNVIGAALAGMQGVVWAMVAFSCIYFIWMAVLGRCALANNTGDLNAHYENDSKTSLI
jgi:O-antigen/teichoic acid export membrane protein